MSRVTSSDCISKVWDHLVITFNMIFAGEQSMLENRVVFLNAAKYCLIMN